MLYFPDMDGLFEKTFLKFLFTHPFKFILVSIVIVTVLFFSMFNLYEDFSYKIFFTNDDPDLIQVEQFEKEFSGSDSILLAIYSPSGIFDKESIQLIQTLTEKLWQTPYSLRVDSLSNFSHISSIDSDLIIDDLFPDDSVLTPDYLMLKHEIADSHFDLKHYLINAAFDVSMLYIQLAPGSDLEEFDIATNFVRKLCDEFRSGDHEFYLHGSAVLTYSFKEGSMLDLQRLTPFVLAAALLFLWVTTRTFLGTLLAIVLIAFVSISTYGVIAFFGIPIHNLTVFVVQILIGISIADITHILVTLKSFLRVSNSKQEALFRTAKKNFMPTFLTSLTTSFGFFSFLIADIPALKDFGVMAGFGTLIAWVYTYSFVIPMLFYLPIKLRGDGASKALVVSSYATAFTTFLCRYKRMIYIGYLCIFIGALYIVFGIKINSDPIGYFDKQFSIAKSTQFLSHHFGAPIALEVIVDSGQDQGINQPDFLLRSDQLQQWLIDLPAVTHAHSLISVIKNMNQHLNKGDLEFYNIPDTSATVAQELFLYTLSLPQGLDINHQITNKQDKLRITAMISLRDSADWLELMDHIEQKAHSLGLHVIMTGRPSMFQRMVEPLSRSLIKSLILAVCIISLVLFISIRSFRLGVLAFIPNTLPILIGGSLFPILGEHMDYGSILVGSVCLGIAVDDTIHVITNYMRHIANGLSPKEAVAHVLSFTFPALFATTITLVVTFGMLMFGSFVPNQNLGKYTAIVLSLALFIDLTLLPLLLMDFSKKKS